MNNYMNSNNIFAYRGEAENKNLLDRDTKISQTTKQLEELFRIRELQKKKIKNFSKEQSREQLHQSRKKSNNNFKNKYEPSPDFSSDFARSTAINSTTIDKQVHTNDNTVDVCQHYQHNNRVYSYLWDAYWPFNGSCDNDPKLDVELDYLTFNGVLMEKWSASLPTPATTVFPIKDIFKFTLVTNSDDFDFNIKMENLPSNNNSVVIDINPNSLTFPFNLNQFVLVKDPNIPVTIPGESSTDVLAIMAYYNSNEIYLNQFTQTMDLFEPIKNILLSTQIFFVHINQIKDFVKLTIAHGTTTGENLFKVTIETSHLVEIKEVLVPVCFDLLQSKHEINSPDVDILMRTVYINGKYFMTCATYINNINIAQQLPNISGIITDLRQTPVQLMTMLLFDPVIPLINLENATVTNDHQRLLVKLFREVLQKNP